MRVSKTRIDNGVNEFPEIGSIVMKHLKKIAFSLVFLLCALPASAADLSGRVVRVADGDTLTILTAEQQQIRVRLAEIDAPERNQPWGKKSKETLAGMAAGRQARIEVVDVDGYGRTVGRPYVGELDVCAEQIKRGAAWVYPKYLKRQELLRFEYDARAAQRGLWALPPAERVAPWEWRRMKRSQR